MTEQLRALAAPAEDKSLVPALTLSSSQFPAAPVPGDAVPLQAPIRIQCVYLF